MWVCNAKEGKGSWLCTAGTWQTNVSSNFALDSQLCDVMRHSKGPLLSSISRFCRSSVGDQTVASCQLMICLAHQHTDIVHLSHCNRFRDMHRPTSGTNVGNLHLQGHAFLVVSLVHMYLVGGFNEFSGAPLSGTACKSGLKGFAQGRV